MGCIFFEILERDCQPHPSLILLDVNMPRMNGLETLAKIKSIPSLCRVPVVMCSTSEDPLLIEQAYQIGVATFTLNLKRSIALWIF
ncbi:response regulator [Dyadobacter alkalitolerans]|uniref:response regulator n=1 Tax=Dyadobacter alkalitolerans TaxID=492736 RepID=UPI00047A190C